MELTIAKLPKPMEKTAVAALRRIHVHDTDTWRRPSLVWSRISLLNLASVCFFLDHVADLEGLGDARTALEKTQFRNLPWWETSVWIPVDFRPPADPIIKESGNWPIFLGSCQGLLADLAKIRRVSDMGLGTTPEGYRLMREDYKAFVRSDFAVHDDRSIIQWVWMGLHEAAERALLEKTPVLGMA